MVDAMTLVKVEVWCPPAGCDGQMVDVTTLVKVEVVLWTHVDVLPPECMVSVTGHMVVYTVVYSVVVISPPGDVVETGPTGEEDGYAVRVSVITVVTVDTDSYVLVRVFHPDVYVAVTGQVVT
jgi:hypothetical protein